MTYSPSDSAYAATGIIYLRDELFFINRHIGQCETKIREMEHDVEIFTYDLNEQKFLRLMKPSPGGPIHQMYNTYHNQSDAKVGLKKRIIMIEKQRKLALINKANEMVGKIKEQITFQNLSDEGFQFIPYPAWSYD
jgi:hypothetical protein